jgi:putative transcriptional regulator
VARKKYRSEISRSVHRAMTDLHEIGLVDTKTMRELDRMCLTKADAFKPAGIRAIRSKAGVSQAVFAEHLGVTTGLVSKWECGEKRPSRMALKMLALVKAKGLDVIA